ATLRARVEPSLQHFRHGREVVRPFDRADAEATIAVLPRAPVDERHERADRLPALERRDVYALDAPGRHAQVEATPELRDLPRAFRRGVAARDEALARVRQRHLDQAQLVAPLGRPAR